MSIGYTDIYQQIYGALKSDSLDGDQLNVFARKITDSIWELQLSLDHGNRFQNTLEKVNKIINDRFK
jgi:uncharacterized protein YjaG (DUF416 family)